MALADKEVVTLIEGLIEICKDGQQGYKDAADDIKDEDTNKDMTKMLLDYSMQREKFAYELQLIVKTYGGDVELAGSLLGGLHRRWMDIRFGIAGNNPEAILNECLRGDKAAISHYNEVLKSDLPDAIKIVINRQLEEITEDFDVVGRLVHESEHHVPNI